MKKSQRLQVIIDLHLRQEKAALETMGRVQQTLQAQQDQLQHLNTYRIEYGNKLLERQKLGMNVNQLLEFRAFADKLDKAIDGQRQTVAAQERELSKARRHWEECHQRTKSLQRVSELAVIEEVKLENKREQAEQDARAGRAGRKTGTSHA
ncbi:MAG: flagellar export protein FliJ [Pseudomonadota bacterium]